MLHIEVRSAKPTVLVVDDSPELRRYFRVLLESEGYPVLLASDGIEGVQLVRMGTAVSVVLLDLQMPGMDGLQTLRCLHELKPDLRVIICSGVEDPNIIRDALAAGAHTYLLKPIQRLYLSAAIHGCLSEDRSVIMPAQSGSRLITMASPVGCRPN